MIIDNLWFPDDDIPPEILARVKARKQKRMNWFLWYPLAWLAFILNLYLISLVVDLYPKLPKLLVPVIYFGFYLIPYGLYKLIVMIIKCVKSESYKNTKNSELIYKGDRIKKYFLLYPLGIMLIVINAQIISLFIPPHFPEIIFALIFCCLSLTEVLLYKHALKVIKCIRNKT